MSESSEGRIHTPTNATGRCSAATDDGPSVPRGSTTSYLTAHGTASIFRTAVPTGLSSLSVCSADFYNGHAWTRLPADDPYYVIFTAACSGHRWNYIAAIPANGSLSERPKPCLFTAVCGYGLASVPNSLLFTACRSCTTDDATSDSQPTNSSSGRTATVDELSAAAVDELSAARSVHSTNTTPNGHVTAANACNGYIAATNARNGHVTATNACSGRVSATNICNGHDSSKVCSGHATAIVSTGPCPANACNGHVTATKPGSITSGPCCSHVAAITQLSTNGTGRSFSYSPSPSSDASTSVVSNHTTRGSSYHKPTKYARGRRGPFDSGYGRAYHARASLPGDR